MIKGNNYHVVVESTIDDTNDRNDATNAIFLKFTLRFNVVNVVPI